MEKPNKIMFEKSLEELNKLFAEVDESTAEFAPVLKLPTPKTPLVESLSEATPES